MMKKDYIHPVDEKYLQILPEDPNFDPAHNKRVIEESIKKHEANRQAKERENTEGIKERAEAMARYVKSLQQGKATSDVEKYFGKRHLAYLRGEEVMARIKDQLKVIGNTGKIIREYKD